MLGESARRARGGISLWGKVRQGRGRTGAGSRKGCDEVFKSGLKVVRGRKRRGERAGGESRNERSDRRFSHCSTTLLHLREQLYITGRPKEAWTWGSRSSRLSRRSLPFPFLLVDERHLQHSTHP